MKSRESEICVPVVLRLCIVQLSTGSYRAFLHDSSVICMAKVNKGLRVCVCACYCLQCFQCCDLGSYL